MREEFTPRLRHQNRQTFRADELDELLADYRYFKELRNAEIHEGGRASERLVDAYNQISGLSPRAVGMKQVPESFGHRRERRRQYRCSEFSDSVVSCTTSSQA